MGTPWYLLFLLCLVSGHSHHSHNHPSHSHEHHSHDHPSHHHPSHHHDEVTNCICLQSVFISAFIAAGVTFTLAKGLKMNVKGFKGFTIFAGIFAVTLLAMSLKFTMVVAPLVVWIAVIGSVLVISLVPLPFLYILPIKPNSPILRVLMAFAAGSLLGDVFLHLIPHAMSHDPSVHVHGNHVHVGSSVFLLILIGIVSFFAMEKIIPFLVQKHAHTHDESKANHEHSFEILQCVADATHNFTDGMFLAATYLSAYRSFHISDGSQYLFFSWSVLARPIVDTLVVLIHEIPHEIGDFAILIQLGRSKWSAIFLQIVTAGGALLGAIVVLLLGTAFSIENFVLPITAGGFIYISLADILPALLNKSESSVDESAFQFLAMIFGIALMHGITFLEQHN